MELTRSDGNLTDPGSEAWGSLARETVQLAPVPLDAQPTEYIRTSWSDRAYGRVREVAVSAAHDGDRAFLRIEWAGGEESESEFHDAAAVYFPTADGAAASTIGSPDIPVRLCLWQANLPGAKALIGTGPGRFRPDGDDGVTAAASLENGRWSVVIGCDLDAARAGRFGVAVWDGSNDERAGIGAATPEWVPLEITTETG
jgi:steroid C-25 hydroxylase gamma subunit